MRYYVITYSRSSGTQRIETYQQQQDAIEALRELSDSHQFDPDVEDTLFRAASLDQMQKTHGRYFA